LLAIGLVIALILPARRVAREPARKAQCVNNLKQIALALLNYRDTFHTFPPAYTQDADGKRLHSWRTMILPYMEQASVHRRVKWGKPWDDAANQAVREMPMNPWVCPSLANVAHSGTTYLAVLAPDGVFSGTEGRLKGEVNDESPVCMMVVEVSEDRAVNWMSPHDISEAEFLEMLHSDETFAHDGGVNVVYSDGSAGFLKVDTTAEELRELISINNKKGKR
jgi:prepilin-type processing-associated H-X9-DG protein